MTHTYKTVFINFLRRPQRVFYTICEYELYKYKYHLLVLAGINAALTRNWWQLADTNNNFFFRLLGAIAIGALLAWIPFLFVSWLLYVSGKWINGRSHSAEITNLVAYAVFFPAMLSILTTLISITILRVNGFESVKYVHNLDMPLHSTFYLTIKIHQIIIIGLNLYYVLLVLKGLTVIQNFNWLKSILNVIMAIGLVAVPLLLIAIIPLLFKH